MRSLSHIPALDGLRAVALLPVLIFHTSTMTLQSTALPGGFIGVDVFFVLSGFLITALILGEQRWGRLRIGAFYRRRALRLLPALVAALGASTIYAVLTNVDLRQQAQAVLTTLFYVQNWANLRLGPRPAGTLGYWSLSVEEQFYLVWPWVMLTGLALGRRLRVVVPVLASAIVLIAIDRYVAFRSLGWFTPYFRTDTHADGLLVGALLAHLWVRRRTPERGVRVLGWLCLAGFVFLLRTAHTDDPWLFAGGFTLINCGTAVVLLGLLNGHWVPAWILSTLPFTAIGRVSYGAYLWHGLAYHVTATFFPLSSPSLGVMLGFGLTAAVTMLSWFSVERPFLQWKDRLEEPPRTPELAPTGEPSTL